MNQDKLSKETNNENLKILLYQLAIVSAVLFDRDIRYANESCFYRETYAELPIGELTFMSVPLSFISYQAILGLYLLIKNKHLWDIIPGDAALIIEYRGKDILKHIYKNDLATTSKTAGG